MLRGLLISLSHFKMWLLVTAIHLFYTPNQSLVCQVYGSVYEVNDPYLADLIIFEELSEVTADLLAVSYTHLTLPTICSV